jgi:hypothetical protein
VVIADGFYGKGACGQEYKVVTDVSLLDNTLSLRTFRETEFGMSNNLHQVSMAHALKEREL